jgi:hypothetical protein
LGNVEPDDLADSRASQSFINATLPQIGFDGTMRLDGGFADMGVVFRHEDDTVNPEAQPLGETKLMPRGIKLSVLD